MFYCPKCGKTENWKEEDFRKHRKNQTLVNIRDGYGRPIRHYLCDCGNYLAGEMCTAGYDEDGIEYAKHIITAYNEGGNYFEPLILKKAKENLKKLF